MVLYVGHDVNINAAPTIVNYNTAMDKLDLHPLFVSPVLHSILEFLPVSDLLTCRRVCKVWDKTAARLVRQNKTVKFRMKKEPLDEFTLLMRTSQHFPFARFELEFYYMNDSSVQDFINICGPYITSLQLNNCRTTTTQLFRLLQIELPNLKSFSINCDPIEDTGRLQQALPAGPNSAPPQLKSLALAGEFCRNEGLLIDLLKFSPTLDALKIRCYDVLDDFSPFEQLCFSVFLNNDHTPNASRCIENLHIEFRMTETHLDQLLQKNLRKLKYLHLNLSEQVRPDALIRLLSSYSNTLKKLELDFKLPDIASGPVLHVLPNNGHAIPVNAPSPEIAEGNFRNYKIPKMCALTRITLTNFKGDLCFLNDCDALQYLTLINCSVTQATLQSVQPHQNVRSFVSTQKLNDQICLQLAGLFPHLKELQTELNDMALRVVFDQMCELEQLLIFGGDEITDDSITGIRNIFELMTIYDSINGLNDEEDEEEEEDPNLELSRQIPHLRTQPSITNLKNLRKIKIHDASSLTDAAVRYGIILCPKLTEISFLNSHVTDASLEAIADNLIHLDKLELLSNITEFTTAGRNYVKSKLPACDLILGQTDLMNLYRPRPTSLGTGTGTGGTRAIESGSQVKVAE